VVALTHDPKLDDLALMEALKSPAFYVGALGSRANNAKRRERLREFDLSDSDIARLHGPIGVYIGSRTPPEIAISILAEITAVKNGVDPGHIATVAAGKERRSVDAAPLCEVAEEIALPAAHP
jgi:xanthine dehydrogenase accessory factor